MEGCPWKNASLFRQTESDKNSAMSGVLVWARGKKGLTFGVCLCDTFRVLRVP